MGMCVGAEQPKKKANLNILCKMFFDALPITFCFNFFGLCTCHSHTKSVASPGALPVSLIKISRGFFFYRKTFKSAFPSAFFYSFDMLVTKEMNILVLLIRLDVSMMTVVVSSNLVVLLRVPGLHIHIISKRKAVIIRAVFLSDIIPVENR